MAQNVEIKARLRDRAAIEEIVKRLATSGPEDLHQEDVFFQVANGRLKLRTINGTQGELIAYERENSAGPKLSNYLVVAVNDPYRFRVVLETACGVRGVIRKTRRLYLIDNTRVHLDAVEGLGDFLEFEVVLRDGQTVSAGEEVARRLMAALGMREEDLVASAYIDLLLGRDAQPTASRDSAQSC